MNYVLLSKSQPVTLVFLFMVLQNDKYHKTKNTASRLARARF